MRKTAQQQTGKQEINLSDELASLRNIAISKFADLNAKLKAWRHDCHRYAKVEQGVQIEQDDWLAPAVIDFLAINYHIIRDFVYREMEDQGAVPSDEELKEDCKSQLTDLLIKLSKQPVDVDRLKGNHSTQGGGSKFSDGHSNRNGQRKSEQQQALKIGNIIYQAFVTLAYIEQCKKELKHSEEQSDEDVSLDLSTDFGQELFGVIERIIPDRLKGLIEDFSEVGDNNPEENFYEFINNRVSQKGSLLSLEALRGIIGQDDLFSAMMLSQDFDASEVANIRGYIIDVSISRPEETVNNIRVILEALLNLDTIASMPVEEADNAEAYELLNFSSEDSFRMSVQEVAGYTQEEIEGAIIQQAKENTPKAIRDYAVLARLVESEGSWKSKKGDLNFNKDFSAASFLFNTFIKSFVEEKTVAGCSRFVDDSSQGKQILQTLFASYGSESSRCGGATQDLSDAGAEISADALTQGSGNVGGGRSPR